MSAQYGSEKPLLDARLEGMGLMSCPANTTQAFYYTVSLSAGIPHVNFSGISIYCWDSNKGDYMTLWTEYWNGTAWKRYKKFAKEWMVMPNTEMKDLLFPTTPTNGVRIVIEYNNVGNAAVDFIVNLYNFIDQQKVSPSLGQEGEDW